VFTALRNRALITAATGWVHEAIMAALEEPIASDCSAAFVLTLKQDLRAGKLKSALDQSRASRLHIDEIGLSLLDGVVTTLRQLIVGKPHDAGIERIIGGLESTIDAAMLRSPGRVLPRNGAFARAAGEVGLDRYFRCE
jgi:hypothetical protein